MSNINYQLLKSKNCSVITVEILQIEAEIDEMWSFVGNKKNQRWLWHAIDHQTGEVLAYVFGERKDVVFRELKKLLEPFGIQHFILMIGAHAKEIFLQHNIRLANVILN